MKIEAFGFLKFTIFSIKWFEGENYIFISYMCGFQTSSLSFCSSCMLLYCYSLDNGLSSCLILFSFWSFLAVHIYPTIILPRKWGEGLKIELNYVEFCCGCCFSYIRYTELNNNTLSVFHESTKELPTSLLTTPNLWFRYLIFVADSTHWQ